jgi:hypothetical protein
MTKFMSKKNNNYDQTVKTIEEEKKNNKLVNDQRS